MNPFPDSLEKGHSAELSSFQDSEALFQTRSEGKKKLYICQVPDCGKSFRYKSEIHRHVATHSSQRPHTCPFEACKKSFKRGDALENHIRTHTKDTPFICEIENCGQSFTTKASLRYHVLKHKDQKIFKCTYPGCSKAFITVFQLKQHEKSNCVHKKLKDPLPVVSVENKEPHKAAAGKKIMHEHDDGNPMKQVKTEIPPFYKNSSSVWNSKDNQVIPASMGNERNQDFFEDKVKEILSENQILKKKLELSQKIIGLLQHQYKYEPLNIPEYAPPEMMAENILRFQFYNNIDN